MNQISPIISKNETKSLFLVLTIVTAFFTIFAAVLFSSEVFADDENKKIKVAWYPYAGYQETDSEGNHYGYNAEYLQLISQYTNWEYEYVKTSWADGLDMLEKGQVDLFGCLMYTDERQEKYGLPDIDCGVTYSSLFVKFDNEIAFNDFEAFQDMRVACNMSAQNYVDFLEFAKVNGFSVNFINYEKHSEIVDAVRNGDVDAGILGSYQDEKDIRTVAKFAPRRFCFATTKGNEEVLKDLNEAMENIKLENPLIDNDLSRKYDQTSSEKIVFTKSEASFIQSCNKIRIVYTEAWEPLEITDPKTGEFSGIVFDITETIAGLTGLDFEYLQADSNKTAAKLIQKGQADAIASYNYNPETANKMDLRLSTPYLNMPLSLIGTSKTENPKGRTATPEHYYAADSLSQMDDCEIVFLPTVEDCIESVRNGDVNQAIVNSYSASNLLSQNKYSSLQMATLVGDNFEICFAVGEDMDSELLSILNKAISSISVSQMNGMIIKNTVDTQNLTLQNFLKQVPTELLSIFILGLFAIVIALLLILRSKIKSSRKIQDLLYIDQLTGLFNITGFEKEAQKTLEKHRYFPFIAILDFDVNAFEQYNALYGFDAGDDLLCNLANTIKNECSKDEICARISADHFVCLMFSSQPEYFKERIEDFNRHLQNITSKQSIFLSYGIFEITNYSTSISIMCDKAMAAKRTIKGNYEHYIAFYDEELHNRRLEDAELISNMELALEKKEFEAYYQPKFDAISQIPVGAEALVRWRRSEGMINPDRFIGIFEKNGLISKLDNYMFDAVCQKIADMKDKGIPLVPISINFSRAQLYDLKFADKLNKTALNYKIPVDLLQIEFTESAFWKDKEDMIVGIKKLHEFGFSVAIDDFGSGFSSLNILKDIPFDVLKIDRIFLSSKNEDEKAEIVIRNVLSLAQELKLQTVAEGVETKEQFEFLRQNGCDIIQGYYFSRPLPEKEFNDLLTSL
ncbi:MAG: EAL domain-containing protein [Clostridiales bacterium]|nr:EAL domain-containing protein [Clostridiales bacterium]